MPYEVEQESVQNAKENDGEILAYTEERKYSTMYSEVACSKFKIAGYFFMSFGEGELNPVYEKSKRMAEARNIELKEIDLVELREKSGLPPMNEAMKKDLCRNLYRYVSSVLNKNNPDKPRPISNQQFVEDNYEKFYERYMRIRKSPEFNSKMIMKEFVNTILEYRKDMGIEI